MKKLMIFPAAVLFFAALLQAEPVVDGKVDKGEYATSKALLGGAMTFWYAPDGKGGLYVALQTKTKGWAGIGLGSKRMDGAFIYMGFVSGGTPVFSEQLGRGHRHSPVKDKTTDANAVTQVGGVTVLEFHIPADKMPVKTKAVPFIAAYSTEADLATFHEDNYDNGTFTLP